MQRGGAGEEAGDPRHLWSASQTARYKDKSPPIAGGGQVDSVAPALACLASGAGAAGRHGRGDGGSQSSSESG